MDDDDGDDDDDDNDDNSADDDGDDDSNDGVGMNNPVQLELIGGTLKNQPIQLLKICTGT